MTFFPPCCNFVATVNEWHLCTEKREGTAGAQRLRVWCTHHVMSHDEEMLLSLVQDEVRPDGRVPLNGDDRVLLHLAIRPQKHLRRHARTHTRTWLELLVKTYIWSFISQQQYEGDQ